MVEIAFEQNPWRNWVGGKMITESRDTIDEGKKGVVKEETAGRVFAVTIDIQKGGGEAKSSWNCPNGLYLQIEILLFLISPFFYLCPVRLCVVHDKLEKFRPTAFDFFSRERNILFSRGTIIFHVIHNYVLDDN